MSGEIDLAASLPVSDDFEWQDVRYEPLMVTFSAEHALAQNKAIDLTALRDEPFILFETGFAVNRIILDGCRQRGFEPTVVARSSPLDFIVELTADGLGIAFLPRMIAEQRSRPAVRYVPLSGPKAEWHIALIWRRGAYIPHAAKVWLALACEVHDGVVP